MKIKKLIAWTLLASTVLTLLASCKKKNQEVPPAGTEAPNIGGEIVDTWVDYWDDTIAYTGVKNDTAQDTNGVAADGSFFDSFQHSRFWQLREQDKQYVTTACENGVFRTTVPHVGHDSYLPNARYFQRIITPFQNYEAEVKMRIPWAGEHQGFYVQVNHTRVMVHIYENKLRVNPQGDTAYKIYADVGTDWHVYRVVSYNGVAYLYMDGVLLLTFELNYYQSASPEISIYTSSGGPADDGITEFDYVYYKSLDAKDLTVVTPTSRQTLAAGTTTVDVTCAVSETLKATGKPLEFYFNDVYAGSSDTATAKMSFSNLCAGTYKVYVKCGDTVSSTCIFSIAKSKAETQADSLLSTAQALQSNYVLRYTVSGDGTVTAGDGMHLLSLQHTGSSLTYTAKDGVKSISGGAGNYIAVVDGGVAYLYQNGKLTVSYMLPYTSCGTAASATGAISGLTVEAHNATLFKKQCNGIGNYSTELGYLPSAYALEFEYTYGNEANIQLCDGAYLISLSIGADGIAKGYVSEQSISYETMFNATEGTNIYRVSVSSGIAQIFVNNAWVKSFCLPTTVLSRGITVGGKGLANVQIRETNDKFFFSANAGDAEWDQYFSIDELNKAHTLKTYAKNTTVEATLNVTANASGLFYLVARYDSFGRGIIAGYDFSNDRFVMGTDFDHMSAVGTATLGTATSAKLKLVVEDNKVTLYCNGTKVGELSNPTLNGSTNNWYGTTEVNGWGNVGYYSKASGVTLQAFAYEGDSNAVKGTLTHHLESYHSVTVLEVNGNLYLAAMRPWKSEDNGKTFEEVYGSDEMRGTTFNSIVLKSGNVLYLSFKHEEDGYINYAYVYKPDGVTLVGGPYKVQDTPLSYRSTMNGRLFQTSSGRIIFICGETRSENSGGFTIYYTDREGYMWKKGTNFSVEACGYALLEGYVVELAPNHLRAFGRSELGFLYYCDSFDDGLTWSMDFKPSVFPAVSSCYGVRHDPATGAVYMVWEHNNNNDNSMVQYPRTRLALSVSYDGGVTWYYVGDMDDNNHGTYNSWIHMNAGISITSDAIYVTVAKQRIETKTSGYYNYMVRVDKSSIVPLARFNQLHAWRDAYETEPDETVSALPLAGTLLISPDGKKVYASGAYYDFNGSNGKRTMLSAEIIASFMGGTLTRRPDGAAVITVGNAQYIFTAGSDKAMIAGSEKSMTFAAVAEDGTVKVSIEDLDNLLGLTAKQTEAGGIVLTFGDAPMNLEMLFANAGI